MYTFSGDGSVNTGYYSNESVAYSINGNTLTVMHKNCSNVNICDEWSESITLNSSTGEVSKHHSFSDIGVVSSSPIVKIVKYGNSGTLKKLVGPINKSKYNKNEFLQVKEGKFSIGWF